MDVSALDMLKEAGTMIWYRKMRYLSTDKVSFIPMQDLGIYSKSINLKQERKLSEVQGNYIYFAEDDVLLAKIMPCFNIGRGQNDN